MRRTLLALMLACACSKGGGKSDPPPPSPRPDWPPSRTQYVNPIPAENQRPGDPTWSSGFTASWNHQVEGFADRVSASAGESVTVRAHASVAKTGKWTLYRLGHYGGAGARKISEGTTSYAPQAACTNNLTTGLVSCAAWTPTFSLTVPQDAVSGLYVIRLLRDDNYGSFVPLVVKDTRPADLLFQSSVTTYEAYNQYGGESLYVDNDDGIAGHKALQVSFDRPYKSGQGTGNLLSWEIYAAAFFERYGYDVTYTTNLDVHREGAQTLVKRGGFLSVGHDEYWTGEERNAVEAARDAGVPLFFLTANPAYWKIRLSDPGVDGNARTITCYKQYPSRDPLAGTADQTGRFRDAPISRPEEALTGVMYESWMFFGHPWVVSDASHFIFQGTGLQNSDVVPLLVGYEYDRTFNGGTPGPASVVAHSPVVDAEGRPGFSESTVYRAPSGAMVFGAGTIYWTLGLSGGQADARVQRMTANLLNAALKLNVPDGLATITPPAGPSLNPAWATDVNTLGAGMQGPAGVAQLPDGTVLVADARGNRIWKLVSGTPQPFAGDGNPSGDPAYDNVTALRARFYQPTSLAVDSAGRVYVADTHNHVIRLIDIDANRTVSTFAGAIFQPGLQDGTGSTARFNDPMGLSWQDATHLIVADSANHAIRVIDVTTKAVSTLAVTHWGDDVDGPASSATFYFPTATAAGPDGRVYFVSSSTGKVRSIGTDAAHTVTTLVAGGLGLSDGAGTTAQLLAQGGLVWDGQGLVVADSGNQRLRLIVPGTDAASTRVQTIAGSGKVAMTDGSAAAASFAMPLGLFRPSAGTVYVADGGGSVRVLRR